MSDLTRELTVRDRKYLRKLVRSDISKAERAIRRAVNDHGKQRAKRTQISHARSVLYKLRPPGGED